METFQGNLKLRVKINKQEFEAEGQADLVRAQFEVFRQLMQGALRSNTTHPFSDRNTNSSGDDTAVTIDAHPRLDHLKRVIRTAPADELLSLHQPPAGATPEADAVLLLLFAYKQLRGDEDIPVTTLNAALTQSGCRVKRLDRILKDYLHNRSIVRTGRGKGGKYRLTNLGFQKAEELLLLS